MGLTMMWCMCEVSRLWDCDDRSENRLYEQRHALHHVGNNPNKVTSVTEALESPLREYGKFVRVVRSIRVS
jgi:hypothetical protein